MLSGTRILVFGVDPKRWAERHGIEPFSAACTMCSAKQTTSIPMVVLRGDGAPKLYGMTAPKCACGHPWPPYCVLFPEGELFRGAPPKPLRRKRRRLRAVRA